MPADPAIHKTTDEVLALKIRVLKILFFCGIASLAGFWITEYSLGVIGQFDLYALPFMIIFCGIAAITLFIRPIWFPQIVLLVTLAMAGYFILSHWLYFIWPDTASHDGLSYQQAKIVQWYVLVFIAAFVFFEQKPALLISIGLYLGIALPELWFLFNVAPTRSNEVTATTVISLIANPVYIVCLWGVSLIKAHTRDVTGLAAILAEAASKDALTGILNRRGISRTIESLMQAGKAEVPIALILFDIDHFKQINDRFGHDKGDTTLVALTALVSRKLRPDDHIARWGGEEFLIVGRDMTPEMATALAERLRLDLEHSDDSALDGVTASFGISHIMPEKDSFETALQRADKALYAAKAAGRNCVKAA